MIRKQPINTETFEFYNANPKNKRTGDCVIRSIATATSQSWDKVLDDLVELSHKYKLSPTDTKCYKRYLESLEFTKMPQPRHSDGTKFTGNEFCQWCNGEYHGESIVAHIGGHHMVAICSADEEHSDYKVLDTWDSTDGCIGNYWVESRNSSPYLKDLAFCLNDNSLEVALYQVFSTNTSYKAVSSEAVASLAQEFHRWPDNNRWDWNEERQCYSFIYLDKKYSLNFHKVKQECTLQQE